MESPSIESRITADPLDGCRVRGRRAGGTWTIILSDGKVEGFGSGSILEEALRSAAEDLARQRG